jgi:hypothetical protein
MIENFTTMTQREIHERFTVFVSSRRNQKSDKLHKFFYVIIFALAGEIAFQDKDTVKSRKFVGKHHFSFFLEKTS